MRGPVDAARLRELMRALAASASAETTCYLTGGASAVLSGWRHATIDVDLRFVPENDAVLRAIPALKHRLEVNVELAFPGDFVPLPPGWEERSPLVERFSRMTFRNVDFYAQAFAKLERGHERDVGDVAAMLRARLIVPEQLLEHFEAIAPELYRYPAVDPPTFRAAVEHAARRGGAD